jgi:hypothetical protein
LSGVAKLDLQDAAAVGRLRDKEIVEKNPALANSYSFDEFPVVALASVFGHFEAARYLAEHGADINYAATNGTGYNALTGAVASGHVDLVNGYWNPAPTRITNTASAIHRCSPPPRTAASKSSNSYWPTAPIPPRKPTTENQPWKWCKNASTHP